MEKKKLARQRISGGKKWAKPKLIVLVRGDRQEGVLLVCKSDVDVGNTPVADTLLCAELVDKTCFELFGT